MQRHVSVQVSHCRSTSTLCNKEHCDDSYTIMTMIPFRHLHFHVYILSMSSLRACRLDWMGWDRRCKRLNFNWLIDKHTLFDWLNEFCLQCWAPLKMRHKYTHSYTNQCWIIVEGEQYQWCKEEEEEAENTAFLGTIPYCVVYVYRWIQKKNEQKETSMYANKIDDVNSEEYQPHFRVSEKTNSCKSMKRKKESPQNWFGFQNAQSHAHTHMHTQRTYTRASALCPFNQSI